MQLKGTIQDRDKCVRLNDFRQVTVTNASQTRDKELRRGELASLLSPRVGPRGTKWTISRPETE